MSRFKNWQGITSTPGVTVWFSKNQSLSSGGVEVNCHHNGVINRLRVHVHGCREQSLTLIIQICRFVVKSSEDLFWTCRIPLITLPFPIPLPWTAGNIRSIWQGHQEKAIAWAVGSDKTKAKKTIFTDLSLAANWQAPCNSLESEEIVVQATFPSRSCRYMTVAFQAWPRCKN